MTASGNPPLPGRVPNLPSPAAELEADGPEPGNKSPAPRASQWSLIGGTAVITAGLIFTVVRLLDKTDDTRLVQIAVRRVEAHASLISSAKWEALARREVTSESLARLRQAENEILRTTRALVEKKNTANIAAFYATCSEYVRNVDREVAFVQAGQFEQARQIDNAEVAPSFQRVRELIDLINQEQSRAAEETVFAARMGLIAAALFSTAMTLMYFRRFNIQLHRADLALAERLLAQQNEDRFRTLTEKSADLIMITSPKGEITYISPSVRSVLGWSDREAIGTDIFQHIHPADLPLVQAAFEAVVAIEGASTVGFRFHHSDGTWPDFECITRNLVHDVNIRGLLLNARDVTQDKKAQDILAFSAAHDPLTKLPNRGVFMDRLHAVIERKKRRPGGNQTAVLFLDLDDLKLINDGLGHDTGDLLISEFAKRLRACVRGEDTVARPLGTGFQEADLGTVARIGGDEFIILLEDVRDPSDALRVAQRIQAVMDEPFVLRDQEVFKGVSIGIAFSAGETDARSLIANADIAMYRAKTNGKSRSEVFDIQMHTQITQRLDLEKALRQALEEKQFRLQYQPIVSLATGYIAGLEALVRWQRPGVGLVSPVDFIAIAEEIGLIVPLGEWVLLEACRQAALWNGDDSRPRPYVSVNVSARQFAYPGFVDQVREALRASKINPHRLKVELTEGTAMEDPERAVDLMLQLAELGVTLSIDDFGTGYSSLSVLRRFPVKTLKIDRSFVSTVHTNTQVAAIVTTIIGLARILCMEVVAEGVESLDQLEKLKSAFCDCAQGFLFSMPLSPEAIPDMLTTNLMARLETNGSRAASARLPR